MQLALRPYVTAGVAIVGASVIAATPIAVPPDIEIRAVDLSAAVQTLEQHDPFTALLASSSTSELTTRDPAAVHANMAIGDAPNPITGWAEVLAAAFGNVVQLGPNAADAWGGLGGQLGANWMGYGETVATAFQSFIESLERSLSPDNPYGLPSYLKQAFEKFAAADFAGGVQMLWAAGINPIALAMANVMPILAIPGQIAQNVTNVISELPNAVTLVGYGLIATAADVRVTIGDLGQGVVDAVSAGDALAALNVLMNAPAALANSILNGSQFRPGILAPDGFLSDLMVALPRLITTAITPAESKSPLSGLSGLLGPASEGTSLESSKTELAQPNDSAAARAGEPVAVAVGAELASVDGGVADDATTDENVPDATGGNEARDEIGAEAAGSEAEASEMTGGNKVVPHRVNGGKNDSGDRSTTPVSGIRAGINNAINSFRDGFKRDTDSVNKPSNQANDDGAADTSSRDASVKTKAASSGGKHRAAKSSDKKAGN